MQATQTQMNEPCLESLLVEAMKDPLNFELLESLRHFAKTIAVYGIHVNTCSVPGLLRLPSVSKEKKIQIRDYFRLWAKWVEPTSNIGEPQTIDYNREILFAKRALQHFGLRITDDLLEAIGTNDIIEIYGEDMIQLYRSLNFFQFCAYSLLDISIHEWYVLWERPKMVISQMTDFAKTVLANPVSKIKFDIPKHVLREMMDTGLTQNFIPLACLVEFKQIGSLTKSFSDIPGGFMCTSSAELIAEGRDSINIQFV